MLSDQEQKNDIILFLRFIKQNAKTLLIYAFTGALLATIATFFIKKEYKSYGIVFPPSSTSIDNSIDFPNFGYDVEADRLIQILGSAEIKDSVIGKFNLFDYYEIDGNQPERLDELNKKYYKNMKFERTPAMSVLISARTKDPKLSSDIVNFIIRSADAFREKIYKKNIITAYNNAKQDYDIQKRLVDSLQITLTNQLKKNKLSSLLFLMSDAQISFDMDKLNSINNSSDASIGVKIIEFKGMYELLKEYRTRFIKVKKANNNSIPKLYVINYGAPNYKKIFPSFLINTSFGFGFALFVAMCVLFIKKNAGHD